ASSTRSAWAATSSGGRTSTSGNSASARRSDASETAETAVTRCPARWNAAPSTAPTRPAEITPILSLGRVRPADTATSSSQPFQSRSSGTGQQRESSSPGAAPGHAGGQRHGTGSPSGARRSAHRPRQLVDLYPRGLNGLLVPRGRPAGLLELLDQLFPAGPARGARGQPVLRPVLQERQLGHRDLVVPHRPGRLRARAAPHLAQPAPPPGQR